MSTGADCRFYEKTPGAWFYDLQEYPYGATEDYETAGPFKTFAAAMKHLGRYHANPGGYTVEAKPGCPHDLLAVEGPVRWGDRVEHGCDRCGGFLDLTPAPVLGAAAE